MLRFILAAFIALPLAAAMQEPIAVEGGLISGVGPIASPVGVENGSALARGASTLAT